MKLFVFKNYTNESTKVYNAVLRIAETNNIELSEGFDESVDLILCIGGDGTFLSCMHKCGFPSTPVIGINTGHLGFFQDMNSEDLEQVIGNYNPDDYNVQVIKPVEANIITEKDTFKRIGINEILVRGPYSHVTQLTVSIGNTIIQDFSGDGILISTPVGSTAYNYSLDGSIVSPKLDVLQLTPVAPMNTNTYRSFHSSIILPSDDMIKLEGIKRSRNGNFLVSFDGRTHEFNNVSRVEIVQSDKEIHLLRLKDYDYWKKLKTKLI